MINFNKLFIAGHWVEPSNPQLLEIRSPHDQSLVGTAAQASPADVDSAVAAAREAFDHGPWPKMTPAERRNIVAQFSELHTARSAELAQLVTAENGVPLWFTTWSHTTGIAEQTGAYLRAADTFRWEESLEGTGNEAIVRREPIGVVAAVIPWNAPHQSALVKIVPALLAGCVVILKASPETALDALMLGEIITAAGIPAGVVSILPAGRETSEYLISRPGVDKIAFTGSTAAGRRIAAIAGEQLKRVSLELGGKSASILLDDTDVATAVEGLKGLSLGGNGENCAAHTRILVSRDIYDEVVESLRVMIDGLVVGDPAEADTFVGPMVRRDQQQKVQDYIRLGIEEGARLVTGGPHTPAGLEKGNYVQPTLFADVDNSMRIAQEEIFGPVLVVIPFDDDADAIRIANDSPFGLAGGVWTSNSERGMAVARAVRTGFFTINGAFPGFDGPFGGYKASGIGREFGAVGLAQYVEYKSIGR